MRAFFRAHIRRETRLDEAAADRLAEALTKATNRMLVWDSQAANSASQSLHQPGDGAFDPFAFSVMVVLSRTGREGLLKCLDGIKSAEHLRKLAEAQHLAVPASIKKADELRRAILTATEQRLADRRAAAS